MQEIKQNQFIILTNESVASGKPDKIVQSNIDFINSLKENYFTIKELSQDGLKSYYVDYYLCQVENGGFSQFVYNSGWNEKLNKYVLEGLICIGAKRHYRLFKENESIVDKLGKKGLNQYLGSNYWGLNRTRDSLNKNDGRFIDLLDLEDIKKLNAQWLLNHPDLIVKSPEEITIEINLRKDYIIDYEERKAKALKGEYRYMKIIHALCEKSKQDLHKVTGALPNKKIEGLEYVAWYFITNKGANYMIEKDQKAIMFESKTENFIVELDTSIFPHDE